MFEIKKCAPETTLLEAVKLFNQPDTSILVVVNDEDRLIGTLDARDVRSALMANNDMISPVESFMNRNPVVAHEGPDIEKMLEMTTGYLLILDKEQRVKQICGDPRRWRERRISKDEKLNKLIVKPEISIKKVINILDKSDQNIVLAVDRNNRFLGLATERDVREAILGGHDPDAPLERIMNKRPVTGVEGMSKKDIIRLMESKVELGRLKVPATKRLNLKVPILDKENRLRNLAINDELDPGRTLFFMGDDDPLFKSKVKTVLVTGGAGYIGSILSRKLLKRGYSVKILDNLLYGDGPIRDLYNDPGFELEKGDVRHIEDVVRAIQGVDAVIHLAAIVGDSACSLGPRFTIESNYLATKMLAGICKYHQVNRFLFSSTCSVYGASSGRLRETSELNPVSLYARSKIYSEKAIQEIIDENFSPTILRLGTVYGLSPRPRFDLVLNLFVAKAMRDGGIEIQGGGQYRPMVHVRDVAEAFIACMEAPIEKVRGEIFNIGSNEQNLRIIDLGKEVVRHIPKAKMRYSQSKSDARDYWVYFDKIKNALSYYPEVSLEDGIKELIEFLERDPALDYKDPRHYNHQILPNAKEFEL